MKGGRVYLTYRVVSILIYFPSSLSNDKLSFIAICMPYFPCRRESYFSSSSDELESSHVRCFQILFLGMLLLCPFLNFFPYLRACIDISHVFPLNFLLTLLTKQASMPLFSSMVNSSYSNEDDHSFISLFFFLFRVGLDHVVWLLFCSHFLDPWKV